MPEPRDNSVVLLNWVPWTTDLTAAEKCQAGDERFGGIVFAECADGMCNACNTCQNKEFSISTGTRSRPRSDFSQRHTRHKKHPHKKVAVLKEMFLKTQKPTEQEKSQVARRIHLSTEQVNTWFINYRKRSKCHSRPDFS